MSVIPEISTTTDTTADRNTAAHVAMAHVGCNRTLHMYRLLAIQTSQCVALPVHSASTQPARARAAERRQLHCMQPHTDRQTPHTQMNERTTASPDSLFPPWSPLTRLAAGRLPREVLKHEAVGHELVPREVVCAVGGTMGSGVLDGVERDLWGPESSLGLVRSTTAVVV